MADKYDYKKAGFDNFIRRNLNKEESPEEQSRDESSYQLKSLPGTKIGSGKSASPGSTMKIDWDRPEIYFSDKARKRVQMGNIDGLGTYGLRVIDSLGNTRFESSSDRNFSDIEGRKVAVGTEGDDFTNIQDAIDYINDLGGGTVFIKSGTYTVSDSITLYSNINLVGENQATTIIDFNSTNGSVNATSSSPVYSGGGSFTATTGSATLTGSSTAWLSGGVTTGDIIDIKGAPYEILSVESDTSMTLKKAYAGISVAGLGGRITKYLSNINIENITVKGNAFSTFTGAIIFVRCRDCSIRFVTVKDTISFSRGFNIEQSFNMEVANCTALNVQGNAFNLNSVDSSIVDSCIASNASGGSGFAFSGTNADQCVLRNSLAVGNGTSGIYVTMSTMVFGCESILNRTAGILCEGTVNDITIMGNKCVVNGTYGININGGIGRSVFLGNQCNTNTSGALNIGSVAINKTVIVGNMFEGGITNTATGNSTIIANNYGAGINNEIHLEYMKNNSGGSLALGDIVVFDNVAAGDNITTTTTAGDNLVFGMVAESISNGNYGLVQTAGKTTALKVDGTADIAIGDFISCFTSAKIGRKATSGHTAIAIALEAYAGDDSNGVIDAVLIHPRYIA